MRCISPSALASYLELVAAAKWHNFMGQLQPSCQKLTVHPFQTCLQASSIGWWSARDPNAKIGGPGYNRVASRIRNGGEDGELRLGLKQPSWPLGADANNESPIKYSRQAGYDAQWWWRSLPELKQVSMNPTTGVTVSGRTGAWTSSSCPSLRPLSPGMDSLRVPIGSCTSSPQWLWSLAVSIWQSLFSSESCGNLFRTFLLDNCKSNSPHVDIIFSGLWLYLHQYWMNVNVVLCWYLLCNHDWTRGYNCMATMLAVLSFHQLPKTFNMSCAAQNVFLN